MKEKKTWLFFALVTTVFWGVWGAFIEIPEKSGFPATLGYAVWSLTMIPCSVFALYRIGWKLDHDRRSVILGSAVGLLGAGGQLILFQALRQGPAYIVFPIISLYPVLTIFLALVFLKERTRLRQWTGIILALIAMFFLSNPQINPVSSERMGWLVLAILVFIMWALQAYAMKFSNNSMKAESIFFYMTITALVLSPFAIAMTDFSSEINWGFRGPWLAATGADAQCDRSPYTCICTEIWKSYNCCADDRTCTRNYCNPVADILWCCTRRNFAYRLDTCISCNFFIVRISSY